MSAQFTVQCSWSVTTMCVITFSWYSLHVFNLFITTKIFSLHCKSRGCNTGSLIKVSLALNLEYCLHAAAATLSAAPPTQTDCASHTAADNTPSNGPSLHWGCQLSGDKGRKRKGRRAEWSAHRCHCLHLLSVKAFTGIQQGSRGCSAVSFSSREEHLPSADANISWQAVSLLCRRLPASIFSSFNCLIWIWFQC